MISIENLTFTKSNEHQRNISDRVHNLGSINEVKEFRKLDMTVFQHHTVEHPKESKSSSSDHYDEKYISLNCVWFLYLIFGAELVPQAAAQAFICDVGLELFFCHGSIADLNQMTNISPSVGNQIEARLSADDFDAVSYVRECLQEVKSGDEVKHLRALRSKLNALNNASSDSIRKNIFQNYHQFIETFMCKRGCLTLIFRVLSS
ncbi:unnamed protein product [Enterobius vermicularis]|uniref:Uncharacterized protein n=1 Tax=Enterobius vermicularis TaxID=51028 RepID=A0A0N4V3S7_ENTVE|nr:unnamed protein product [Enterobius vermicularis]